MPSQAFANPVISDVMTTRVHVLAPETPVAEGLRHLADHAWSGAVVAGADRAPLGVFSELDALRVLANARFHGLPAGTVADHMTTRVISVGPGDDAATVALRMLGDGVRRYPVVDDDGFLVGLVTASDLARAFAADIDPDRRADHPPGAAWDPRASHARDVRPR
jgi:CBS domain-containing protein